MLAVVGGFVRARWGSARYRLVGQLANLHSTPSPSQPTSQLQKNEPGTSVQVAPGSWQLCHPSSHSSASSHFVPSHASECGQTHVKLPSRFLQPWTPQPAQLCVPSVHSLRSRQSPGLAAPRSSKPSGHEHVYEPGTLSHIALKSHGAGSNAHSSMSAQEVPSP